MKSRFILVLQLLIGGLVFAQTPNAGMENWSSEPLLLNWKTNSYPLTLPPYDPYIVKKDSDSYSGKWAANLYANGVFKPFAKTTFQANGHPVNLLLYYKLTFAPCVNDPGFPEKDTASVLVELFSQGIVVDQGSWFGVASVADYTLLQIPITQNATNVDSCRITLWGGKVLGGCGIVVQSTEFKVDQLELRYSDFQGCVDPDAICTTCICTENYDPVCGCDGNTYSNFCFARNAGLTNWSSGICDTPTGFQNRNTEDIKMEVYPNPASKYAVLRLSPYFQADVKIELLNLVGEVICKFPALEMHKQKMEQVLDLQGVKSGIYFLRVTANERKTAVLKLVVTDH
jgi:hypothetical protein